MYLLQIYKATRQPICFIKLFFQSWCVQIYVYVTMNFDLFDLISNCLPTTEFNDNIFIQNSLRHKITDEIYIFHILVNLNHIFLY